MKRLLYLGLFTAFGTPAIAQTSIYECMAYTWILQNDIDAVNEFYRPCVIFGNSDFSFQGSSSHVVTSASDIHILPGNEFHAGAYNPDGEMHLRVHPKADFEVAVMNYPNLLGVPLYEKLELGVALPQDILDKIDAYLFDNVPAPGGLNPFMEWDLKVEATFYAPNGVQKKIDGFYYVDMERNPANNNWDYLRDQNDYPFRIRYAPPMEGKWQCQVKIYEQGVLTHTGNIFPFSVYYSANPGFMKVAENKTNFKLGIHPVYPLGHAIPWPQEGEWGQRNRLEEWMYYHEMMNIYLDEGNRFVRVLFHPEGNDIEFEKLGNYYDRMDYAWEMDRVLENLEQRDVYMHLTLLMHNLYMNVADYDNTAWDFNNIGPLETDPQSCYKTELGLTEATQIFTDETAMKYLKQRTRYIISRYGYSTAISALDLGSEMFHAGETAEYLNYQRVPCSTYAPYLQSNDHFARLAVYKYNREMSEYIKYDLDHTEHLLSMVYSFVEEYQSDFCNNRYFYSHYPYEPTVHGRGYPDFSFNLPTVDIIGLNYYNDSPGKHIRRKGNNNQYSQDEDSRANMVHNLHVNFGKPIIYTEYNASGTYEHCSDDIAFKVDNMSAPFTGAGGMYNWHGYLGMNGAHRWDELGVLQALINTAPFQDVYGSRWQQYREISESGSTDNNSLKEHQMYVSENRGKAVGYIYNRSANAGTLGWTSPCTSLSGSYFSEQLRSLNWENDRHHFRGLKPNTNYSVTWYNYLSNTVLSEECFNSYPDGSYVIKHPDLFGWSEPGKPFRPILWFAIRQDNCKSLDEPETDEHANPDGNPPVFLPSVFPNPSNGCFNVTMKDKAGGETAEMTGITVTDMLGSVVYVDFKKSPGYLVDLSGQPAGVYTVRIACGGSTSAIPVVIY